VDPRAHAGHRAFLDPEDRVLLVGDHRLPRITPHVGGEATGPENPLADFLASQTKVAALDVALVCPAHGAVFADHRHRAQQLIAHHEVRAREMWDVLQAGPATAYAVARKAFRWVFENAADRFQAGAAVMETIAHLELLRGRGAVRREDVAGVLEYRSVPGSVG
jgi:glyoxylase-like metal-dependent hydrolase (beta-lactamase superfamily II)